MKKLLAVILAAVVLGAVVPGCGSTHRYDGRLAAVDSLMKDNPDSALALVLALDTADILAEGDRAYRSLLLTQARFRAFVTATSDSDINQALAYFRAHPADREKLTRAYIYKGAVMDELGHPDSAMFYYKTAEATADPDDYFNLGYVKMRMGALYRDNHAMDGKHIKKYEEALECFNRTDKNNYKLMCMVNLGSLYCLKYPNKADSLLTAALTLAEQTKDTIKYVGAAQNLIKNDINRDRYEHARGLVQKVMSLERPIINLPFCLYAASTYSCLQMPDSAELFLELVKDVPITNETDKISYLEAKADIALARGDSLGYLSCRDKCKWISDSLESIGTPLLIITTEDNIERQSHLVTKLSQQITAHWNTILVVAILLMLLLGAVLLLYFNRRRKNLKMQLQRVKGLLDSSESQLTEMRLSLDHLNKLDTSNIKENRLKKFLNSYISLTRDVMEEFYHQPSSKYTQRIKEVIKFQNKNKNKWEKLYDYIDMEFNDIITKTRTNYPQLNDKDLMLVALSAMDFSCIQIALIMGYSNQTSVGTIRKRLCEKMNINGTLNDYIAQFR